MFILTHRWGLGIDHVTHEAGSSFFWVRHCQLSHSPSRAFWGFIQCQHHIEPLNVCFCQVFVAFISSIENFIFQILLMNSCIFHL